MDLSSSSPYRILGLTSDATGNQVRKAYRRMAMRYHPDRNPDNPEAGKKFKQIRWAYEALTGTKQKDSEPYRPEAHEKAFSGDPHPFFDFFRAMRNHYTHGGDSKKHGSKKEDTVFMYGQLLPQPDGGGLDEYTERGPV